MKKFKLLALSFVLALALCACGKEKESPIIEVGEEPLTTEAPADSSEDATGSEVVEEEEKLTLGNVTIGEREVVDGKMQSYLTGEWKDAEVAQRRPMAVMMPNNKAALPQYGISRASIIYEAPVEGRITRIMAVIEDYDDLEFVGPVRSSRDYYVYEAMAYDAIYCNWGLAIPYVEDLLKSDRIDNVSAAVKGIHNPSDEAFFRRKDRGSDYATEYTGYMSIEGYEAAVERRKYETEYRDTFEQAFTFSADGYMADYTSYDDATLIYPGGQTSNQGGYAIAKPWFEYNEEDGLYYRYQFDGKMIDELNDEQVAVSNVVFKICHGEVRDANDYLAFGCHGKGDAVIFTNGKVIEGSWKRDGDNGANMFYDENGDEIIFAQGKTWICNIWDDYQSFAQWK